MKRSKIACALVLVGVVIAASPSIGRYYITHVPASGMANSPFDSWLAKNLLTIDEMDALTYARNTVSGRLSIHNGATVLQLDKVHQDRKDGQAERSRKRDWHVSQVDTYSICAENNADVCLELTHDSQLIYISGVKEAASQRCEVTVNHAGGRASAGKNAAFSSDGAISFYGPKTVGSQQAVSIIQNSEAFLINYVCEFGSYGTYSFKTKTPLYKNKEIAQ